MASSRFFVFSFLLLFASTSAIESSKVSVAVYYESLCPYCSNFIVNYLAKIFDAGLIDIVDLKMIPYGNAKIKPNGTISCQHGPNECLLNTIEACAISVWPELLEFQYAEQTDSLQPPHKYVPWVVVNGQPLYEDYENVQSYICKAYEGEPSKACEELPLITTPEAKANQEHRVSRAKMIMAPVQQADKHDF
ncbi:uncharacterized protein A4U43_C07F6570 [Asparagus officinalis]|uniref:Gamma-interferon-inducible lysosomal thiol reductase n=1 Tax=Asparagus officinalis TaxID=4686 RepID=A0A5P1EA87_ASPOF|nr:gamma-interferon-inducible lysosomal thiol reductase-like [Asparagus officinalis]XP_020271601.1 gamma-interferon-inducible lysosomal thiol reductase-like [Asparagus officinalis]ONK62663.1 uncharacterized protein A4U43_C07F6570 [Asparagus officinalis]